MDYAYALASADTGVGVTEWMDIAIVEMLEWGSVVSERQKKFEEEMRKRSKK